MSAKLVLQDAVDELTTVNKAHAFLNTGSINDLHVRKPRLEALTKRKAVLKKKIIFWVDKYIEELEGSGK